MTAPLSDAEDIVAAEYVLGIGDSEARLRAAERAQGDTAFARAVADWQAHFAGLDEGFAEVPLPDLLPEIEAQLFPAPPRLPLWRRMRTLAPAVIAILIAGWFAFIPGQPDLVATLAPQGDGMGWQAAVTGDALTVAPQGSTKPGEGKDYQLWLIEGGKAPVSLGVLPAAGTSVVGSGAGKGEVLEITLEPKGGAPGDKPSGPVLAKGVLESP